MGLQEELEQQGHFLFRWRSYLPILLLPLGLLALYSSREHTQGSFESLYTFSCLIISFLGMIIRCITVGFAAPGTSGRNTNGQAAEVLNTTGVYSTVRHPLYLANFLMFLGIILFTQVWWFVVISTLIFWLYYERIAYAEESFLRKKFESTFEEWSKRTPAFLPRFKTWETPTRLFSWKKVFGKEHDGFFAIAASFTAVELIKNGLNQFWIIFFMVSLLIYGALKFLKKKTSLFRL